MIDSLPESAERTIQTRWPDYLDKTVVWHSDKACTMVLVDQDYKNYTFRLSLSLDHRWTLIPISGFEDNGILGF